MISMLPALTTRMISAGATSMTALQMSADFWGSFVVQFTLRTPVSDTDPIDSVPVMYPAVIPG